MNTVTMSARVLVSDPCKTRADPCRHVVKGRCLHPHFARVARVARGPLTERPPGIHPSRPVHDYAGGACTGPLQELQTRANNFAPRNGLEEPNAEISL